jgi:outer membrane usher protein FimD/PapC
MKTCSVRMAWSAALVAGAAAAQQAPAQQPPAVEAEFSPLFMQAAGLPPDLSTVRTSFSEGEHWVQVLVNNAEPRRLRLVFDAQGQPCFSPATVKALGVVVPKSQLEVACVDWFLVSRRVELRMSVEDEQVLLTVGLDALAPQSRQADLTREGRAAMLNYRYHQFGAVGASVSGRYLDAEFGANVDEWVVRGQGQVVRQAQGAVSSLRSVYAQKSLIDHKQVLRVGRSGVMDPLTGGVMIDGVQWFADQGLQSLYRGDPIEGVVESTARIELTQQGVLLQSQTVPPGPFRIADYSPLNLQHEVRVRIVLANGSERVMVVPTSRLYMAEAMYNGTGGQINGLTLAAGRLVDATGLIERPVMASASWRFGYPNWSGLAGVVASPRHLGARAITSFRLTDTSSLSGTLQASSEPKTGLRGVYGQLGWTHNLSQQVSLRGSVAHRSAQYRDFIQSHSAAAGVSASASTSWDLAGSWAGGWLGAVSLGVGQVRTDGGVSTNYFAGWFRQWLGLSWSVNLGRYSTQFVGLGNGMDGRRLSVEVGIPMGHLGSYARAYARQDSQTQGFQYGGFVGTALGSTAALQGAVSGNSANNQVSTTVSGSWNTPVAQWSGALSQSGSSQFYSLGATGSVGVFGDGVAWSPAQIGDTFGVVKVGRVSGVPLSTTSGTVRTNAFGLGLIAQLQPYRESKVQVHDAELPDNVEVASTPSGFKPARGAVVRLTVDATEVRRLLLSAVHADTGLPLAGGLSVTNQQGDYLTAVQGAGLILLMDYDPSKRYRVTLGSGAQRCDLEVGPITRGRGKDDLERAAAQCR